jgi:hypothetical protein
MNLKNSKQRTAQQNKAIHVYFKETADVLNESGLTMRQFMSNFELDWTEYAVKMIFQAIGQEKYGKPHTRDWTTTELQGCWEEFNRRISFDGFSIPFPSSTGFTDEIINNYGYDK